MFYVSPNCQQGQAGDCKLRGSTDLGVSLFDRMMFLLVSWLALIHCLVQGVEGKQLSVGAKLDWKQLLSLPSEGPAYHDWKQKTRELVRGRPFDSYDRHIPVLGLGLNNDPFSLLMRLFYSINYPIDKIVLLTGSSVDEHVQRELDHITRHFKNVVVRQGHGPWLGVSESWNAIMTEVPDAPWVFIVSMDIEFAPGSLQRLAHHAWADWDKNQLDQAFIEYCNDGLSYGYSAFVMSHSMISKLGLFDENIFPAYYEDTEYDLRVRKYKESTGLSIHKQLYSDVIALHGLPDEQGGVDHRGVVNAMDEQVSAVPKEKIHGAVTSFIIPYLTKKWGCNFTPYPPDWMATCTFATPFNEKNNISFWQLDKMRRAEILVFLEPTSSVQLSSPAQPSPAQSILPAQTSQSQPSPAPVQLVQLQSIPIQPSSVQPVHPSRFLLLVGCSFFMTLSVLAVCTLFVIFIFRRRRPSAPRFNSHKVISSHV